MSNYTRVYVQLYEYLQLDEFYLNISMIRVKNQTEDLLLSITKTVKRFLKKLIGKQKRH